MPIKKTKTFSGCWTCRRRKVKCDTTNPRCQRCERAGLVCDGYGIPLHWVSADDVVPPSAIKRQAMLLPRSAAPYISPRDLDRILSDLDDDFAGPERQAGPFTIFRVYEQHRESALAISQKPKQNSADRYPDHEVDSDSEIGLGDAIYSDRRSIPVFQRIKNTTDTVTSSESSCQREDRFIRTTPTLLNFSSPALSTVPTPLRHHQNSLTARLIHHYLHNVTELLQPITHPQNPYKTVYLPRAILGSGDLLYVGCKAAEPTPFSNIAMFYSLMATSAFHLQGVEESDPGRKLDSIAANFRALAYQNLRKALSGPLDTENLQTIMSVMLSFITIDVMEGGMTEFWVHLDACNQLQTMWKHDDILTKTGKRLRSVFFLQSTISYSTEWQPNDDCYSSTDVPPEIQQIPLILQSIDDECLQYTYGITARLTCYIRQITVLFQHISYHVSRDAEIPSSLVDACCDLGTSLRSWSFASENPLSIDEFGLPMVSLLECHVLAFYHAIRIFYLTHISAYLMKDVTGYDTEDPEDDIQSHVQLVSDYLRQLDALKSYNNIVKQAAPITWPGFIASLEASPDTRDVWRQWWSSMLQYKIGNIATLWQFVQEAWHFADNAQADSANGVDVAPQTNEKRSQALPFWRKILREQGRKIIAL